MPLSINDIKRGIFILIEDDPYVVISFDHLHMGRGGAVLQTKIKNLRTGTILNRSFKPGESVKEAEIQRTQAKFIYGRQGKYWFHESGNPANRFFIEANALEDKAVFLKPEMEVVAFRFIDNEEERLINIELPIKADYKVIEAPPAIRGNTAQGGTKLVTLEGGAKINVPFFVEEGDTVRVNTETGEYDLRIERR